MPALQMSRAHEQLRYETKDGDRERGRLPCYADLMETTVPRVSRLRSFASSVVLFMRSRSAASVLLPPLLSTACSRSDRSKLATARSKSSPPSGTVACDGTAGSYLGA